MKPKRIADRFITATVCFAPPDVSTEEIAAALSRYADVIEIKELYVNDFPHIKNGKQRVILKPRGELPPYFSVGDAKASLFFAGRVACCPYCEERDHLGRDCRRKREKRCYGCGELGHIKRFCFKDMPGLERTSTETTTPNNTETEINDKTSEPEKIQEQLQVRLPPLTEETNERETDIDETTEYKETQTPTQAGETQTPTQAGETQTPTQARTEGEITQNEDTEENETEEKDADKPEEPEQSMDTSTMNRKRTKEETPPASPSKQYHNNRRQGKHGKRNWSWYN